MTVQSDEDREQMHREEELMESVFYRIGRLPSIERENRVLQERVATLEAEVSKWMKLCAGGIASREAAMSELLMNFDVTRRDSAFKAATEKAKEEGDSR